MNKTLALIAFLVIAPATAFAQGAKLDLSRLDRLADKAEEAVNVDIPSAMLALGGSFLKGGGDQAAAKELLSNLKGIYIRSFEFDHDNGYTSDDVDAIRKQLSAPGWSKIMSVDSKRDRELTEIYSWQEGGGSGGLAIVVAEPMELTVVNIVGPIDLSKLPMLQGQFGIPNIVGTGK